MRIIFNTYIKSKLDYCSTIWSPSGQAEINQLERIQKHFTSKIEGTEFLNILGLETKMDRNGRRILPSKFLAKANANRVKMRHKILICNSFVVKTGRLFNAVHKYIRGSH